MTAQPDSHPGARLGLPAAGPGSVARIGRRLLALLIDWCACRAIAFAVLGVPFSEVGGRAMLVNLLFFVENAILVAAVGATLGHAVVGLQVRSLHAPRVSIVQSLLRALSVSVVLPALFWDADHRGFHDKWAGTVLVRRR